MDRRANKTLTEGEYLAELESVLFAGELKVSADEDEHAGVDAGGLAVDGGD